MEIILYGRPYNRTDRVQWTLEELGLPYEYKKLDVFGFEHRKSEFKSKYGLTRLPFVEIDGKVLFESGAVMIFLAEKFRSKKDLLPATHESSYPYVLQWLFFSLSTLEASDENLASDSKPAPFAPLVDTLQFLDNEIKDREFIAADRFTIADIALATGLKWFGQDAINKYPNVKRYFLKHMGRPCFRKIAEQPEYPKNSAGV